jgi:uncharacterized protein (DUF2141 family)
MQLLPAKTPLFAMSLALAATFACSAAAAADIQVIVTNVRDANTVVSVALFSSAGKFPTPGPTNPRLMLKPEGGTASGVFHDVPEGSYAISVTQDLNGNGVTDTSAFGAPTEPYGVSGNKKGGMMGPPKFEESSFAAGKGTTTVKIELVQP